MSDDSVAALARQAGIAVEWTDAAGAAKKVRSAALRPILEALGLRCDTPARIAESRRLIASRASRLPVALTADVGKEIALPIEAGRAKLVLDDGVQCDVRLAPRATGQSALPPIRHPGYHKLCVGNEEILLAVAPRRCFTVADIAADEKLWGLVVQLYGLRRHGDGGAGDTTALSRLAKTAAAQGADAIALSPVHALFADNPCKFSPYSPSSRLALNPLFADPASLFGAERVEALLTDLGAERQNLADAPLVDWTAAAARKFALLWRLFEAFQSEIARQPHAARVKDFLQFRSDGGDMLESHARFEALSATNLLLNREHTGWTQWPAEWHDPASPAVAAFAAAHPRDVAYHVFLQWVADRSLAAAQAQAIHSGMRIGLIADLAVGMESGGSHAWARQGDMLGSLSIGAPPDLFNPNGQNWGLTTFSPHALIKRGFKPFFATLRAVLRHTGGIRIDHAMGLTRLWVVPHGGPSSEGAYLTYPLDDLLRLIKLESFRHRAIVIGEDLGTVPEGFRAKLADAGIAGMDVLWFAREEDEFTSPEHWRHDAVAMTSTHDLPTVAGWWAGCDIALRSQHGLLGAASAEDEARQRAGDRKNLWDAFRAAGVTEAAAPSPNESGAAVDAAIGFVAKTPAPLVLLPLEDLLALKEQPNLPGTIDEHPNWRRRYPCNVDTLFGDPAVISRIDALEKR